MTSEKTTIPHKSSKRFLLDHHAQFFELWYEGPRWRWALARWLAGFCSCYPSFVEVRARVFFELMSDEGRR